MSRKNGSMIGFYTIGIVALFMAGFMMLIVYGAHVYRDTVQSQNHNNDMRQTLSYIQAAVQGHGEDDIAVREDTAYGTVLIIPESGTKYGQRIYRYQEHLVEDYGRTDRDLAPDSAVVLGETETFSVEPGEAGLYTVRTDDGEILIHAGRKGGA